MVLTKTRLLKHDFPVHGKKPYKIRGNAFLLNRTVFALPHCSPPQNLRAEAARSLFMFKSMSASLDSTM